MQKRKSNKQNGEVPRRESRHVEFKESFDVAHAEDWCEIIKDVVSIANSGGGEMFIGLNSNGSPVGTDVKMVLALDPAQIVDKIAKYTGEQFAECEIEEVRFKGADIARIVIGAAHFPLAFTQPGTYEISPGKQKTAFARGTVYFRHGAKSEPASSKDLKAFVEREVDRVRRSWLGNIRQVVRAPTGSRVSILAPEVAESASPDATPIRIVDDPRAPAYRKLDPDITHPYRQTEVVQRVKEILSPTKVTTYDIFCIRRVHQIDTGKPTFYYKPKFGTPQYSEAFVEWIVAQHKLDPLFFEGARGTLRTLS